MHTAFFLLMVVHGTIHFLPFLQNIESTTQKELIEKTRKSKWYWGGAGILFVSGALLFILDIKLWVLCLMLGVILSQTLIFFYWKQAKFGTILNFLTALVLVVEL